MKFIIGFSTCLAVLLAMSQAWNWSQDETVKQCNLTGSFIVNDKVFSCQPKKEMNHENSIQANA